MLRELRVRDFAIIDHAELLLSGGLTVLTGETGAGKSILVDALEILLGGKVTQEHIRSGCEESCLEVLFDVEACQIAQEILRSQGIPFEENRLVIRRIVTRSGKHRAYLNDQMVTLS